MMNKNISQLITIAEKESKLIIGLMSGTSLDGLDVALCEIKGSGLNSNLVLKEFTTVTYEHGFKQEIKEVFSKQYIDLQKLTLLNAYIGTTHAAIINSALKKWKINNAQIDLIASHGQTIYHAPKNLHQQEKFDNATLQIGDGDHIAVSTGIITISDFRQKNIAAGGEGAPLAVYGDYLLFSKEGEDRILLNIGGISNLTYLPGSLDIAKVFSTDIGPGNTMMDAFIQQHFPGEYFDKDSIIAKKGKVNKGLLDTLKNNNFFQLAIPKTTGPELFNLVYLQMAKEQSITNDLSVEDTMCTLNKFSADMIVDAIKKIISENNVGHIYVSGGGIHNPLLMHHLQEQLQGHPFHTTDSLGILPDAKEAILFAVLANECICGDAAVFALANIPAVSMGKISFPG